MNRAVLLLLATVLACGKPSSEPAPAPAAPPAPAPVADPDPVIGKIDGMELHLGHVRDRLAQLPATQTPTDASLQAILLASEDLLALREMLVLKQQPKPGERPWQAADRFAADVWKGEPTCEADPGEMKLLYLQQLAKYKHPAKFAIWDAQLQCCPDPDQCPQADLQACRKSTEPVMQQLAASLASRWKSLPALGPAADVTDVTVDASPVRGPYTDAFEAAVAELAAKEPRLQLRRYDFFHQGEPGFPASHFRPGEPNVAAWSERAKLGDVSPPTQTVWGWSIALLAARSPTRSGKADPVILAQLRATACQQMAVRQRQEWRDKLLGGAILRWNRESVEAQFGGEVYRRLPRNASRFGPQ